MKHSKKEGVTFTLKDVRAITIVAGFTVAFAMGAVLPFIAHADQHGSDHGQQPGQHQDDSHGNDQHGGNDNHDNGGNDSHDNNGHNDGDHNNDGHGDNGHGNDGNNGHDGDDNHGHDGDDHHDGHDGDDHHGHDGCESDCGNDGGDTTPPPPPPAPTGAIAIIKHTTGGDGTFTFLGTNSFTITTFDGVGEKDFFGVAVGAFTLTETAQDGWTNGEISCVGADEVAGMSVTANATTTCTVTNTKNPVDVCPNIEDVQTSVPEGMTQNNDGQCMAVENGGGNDGGGETTPPPAPPAPPVGGNGPIAGSLSNGGGNGPIMGSVLGASTSLPELPVGCSALLHTYMRMGRHNDSAEVTKLQQFLNKELGSNLTVNGVFDENTDAAVRAFQKAHDAEVLKPWGIDYSTGYVYKTTQRWINLMSCSSLDIPMPELN